MQTAEACTTTALRNLLALSLYARLMQLSMTSALSTASLIASKVEAFMLSKSVPGRTIDVRTSHEVVNSWSKRERIVRTEPRAVPTDLQLDHHTLHHLLQQWDVQWIQWNDCRWWIQHGPAHPTGMK
jgi:hypothetical protein